MGLNTINLLDRPGLGPTCRGPAPSERLQAGRRLSICKTSKPTGQGVTHCLEGELKALCFMLEPTHYCPGLLDCFPLFLRFLAFLIKFALWNWGTAWEVKVFHRREAGKAPWVLLGFRAGPSHPVCNQVSFQHPVDKNPGPSLSCPSHPII